MQDIRAMEWHYPDAKAFASKHGNEAMRELLVNYVITRGNRQSEPAWKEFCVRLKLCTNSTKNISLNMHHFQSGHYGDYHMIRILNGRGQYLIFINVLDTELQQYLGE